MNRDEQYMQRCLDLAAQGSGFTAPNPLVGAVLVYGDKIIGEGYHQRYGEAHAEVNAIRSVNNSQLLQQATLYVNLEPCSHYGKTPPCANLIVEKGIPRVIVGNLDPNPVVAGKGIALLHKKGVAVTTDVLGGKCASLNRRFFLFHRLHRPYIILKWAQSSDGLMAPAGAQRYWLTNDLSKTLVHQWRSQEQAILVGRKTVLADDPELTVRLWQGKNPIRITIDRNQTLPPSAKIFNDAAPTIVFNEQENSVRGNVERVKVNFNEEILPALFRFCYEQKIISVLVEGGATLLNSFIQAGVWDEARVFTADKKLFSGLPAPQLPLPPLSVRDVAGDRLALFRRTD